MNVAGGVGDYRWETGLLWRWVRIDHIVSHGTKMAKEKQSGISPSLFSSLLLCLIIKGKGYTCEEEEDNKDHIMLR